MPGQRKVMNGRVISAKMQKTVVVAVESTKKHSLYGKILRTTKNYLAHDEEGAAKEGDLVKIEESRPLSRRKHWKVIEVVKSVAPVEASE